jgi:threonine dehydrogenase-like Zn-dependent dehydrogenase
VELVVGVDLVPERLERAKLDGTVALDLNSFDSPKDLVNAVEELTDGRGADSVIDAVGTEAHGSPVAGLAQAAAGLLPSAWGEKLSATAGIDRLSAFEMAIRLVRRGGTVSISGVYGGAADPLPMLTMFDKQITLRMGQANVRRWSDEILPLLTDDDPLGVDSFATHHVPLEQAPDAYAMFQKKEDGAIKVVFRP